MNTKLRESIFDDLVQLRMKLVHELVSGVYQSRRLVGVYFRNVRRHLHTHSSSSDDGNIRTVLDLFSVFS
jgi:hypothetical protein